MSHYLKENKVLWPFGSFDQLQNNLPTGTYTVGYDAMCGYNPMDAF